VTPAQHEDFTEGERAIIEKIAWAVGDKIAERVEKQIDDKIATHRQVCFNRITRSLLIVVSAVSAGLGALSAWLGKIIGAAQ